MKLSLTVFAIATSVAACASDAGADLLSGSWGGESMQVSANPARVTITLSCGAVVRVTHSISLDAAGGFSVKDSLRGSLAGGSPHDSLPGGSAVPVEPVLIVGTVAGDRLTLTVRHGENVTNGPAMFEGRRGQPYADSAPCQV